MNESEYESEYATFILRVQLVCGNSKTDTYYAQKDGRILFVKGPVEEVEDKAEEDKKHLGLPCVNTWVEWLIPDLFTDFQKNPLGRRHTRFVDCSKPQPFLISEVLFDYKLPEEIPWKMHSSTVWPETRVVDFSKVGGMSHLTVHHLSDSNLLREFVLTIFYRYVYGMGDLATRNFIVRGDHIYSVDEDVVDRNFDLHNNLRRHPAIHAKINEEVETNREWYIAQLSKYADLELTENATQRLIDLWCWLNFGELL